MAEFTVTIKNQTLNFITNDKVFSPRALDAGTAAMLSVAEFMPDDKVLDLGCGYGAVGILAAKLAPSCQVTMCDISEDALALALKNAQRNSIPVAEVPSFCVPSGDAALNADICRNEALNLPQNFIHIKKSDGFSLITDADFTKILSNPPYHTDFSVAKGFIEDGFSHLVTGGTMYMVTKRREWYKNKLISVFGGVHIDEIDGYYVFTAQKRANRTKMHHAGAKTTGNPQKLSKKLARKEKRKRGR